MPLPVSPLQATPHQISCFIVSVSLGLYVRFQDLSDFIQDVWVKLLKSDEPPRAWCFITRACHFVAYDASKRRRLPTVGIGTNCEVLATSVPGPYQVLNAKEQLAQVLRGMKPEMRAIVLEGMAGYTGVESAKRRGLSRGGMEKRRIQARARVRANCASMAREPAPKYNSKARS